MNSGGLLPYALIAAGGAIGAVSRYVAVGWVQTFVGGRFPWGTLSVNLFGSFLLGVAFVIVVERLQGHSELRSLLMVGFLGAFTTFSTFALESVDLLNERLYALAAAYMIGSVLLCVTGAFLGIVLARALFSL